MEGAERLLMKKKDVILQDFTDYITKCRKLGKKLTDDVVMKFEREFVSHLREFLNSFKQTLETVETLKECIIDFSLDNHACFCLLNEQIIKD